MAQATPITDWTAQIRQKILGSLTGSPSAPQDTTTPAAPPVNTGAPVATAPGPTAPTAPTTVQTSTTPLAPPASIAGLTDYYQIERALEQAGWTGAQAVAGAAKWATSNVPASAQSYLTSGQAPALQSLTGAPTVGEPGGVTGPASSSTYYQAPGVTADPSIDPNGYVAQTLAAYAKNGGSDSVSYWQQKAREWNDPAYLAQRIQYATGGPKAGQDLGGAGAQPGVSVTGSTIPVPQTSPFQDQIRSIILSRLGALSQPYDPNSPEITQPLDAARVEVARAQQQARNALAERLYATGNLNTNELNQGVQQNIEQGGQALGTLRSNLITTQLQNRAAQLQSLLSLAVQTGDTASAQAIQVELANLNAELTRQGYGVNLAEFAANQNANATTAAAGG